MSTKDDERKALEKIRTIIDGLGADSYVGAAFDNYVFNLAIDNINNDFVISTTNRIESANAGKEAAENARRAIEKELTDTQEKLDATREAVTAAAELRKAEQAITANVSEELIKVRKAADDNAAKLAAANDEIVRLKAMLFDYMTK